MKALPLVLSLGCLLVVTAGRSCADGKKDDVPSLIKDLKSKSPKVRISAAEDLGHIGAIRAADAKDAIPVLYEILKKDKDATVRKAAAAALGQMDPDPQEAVPNFIEALKDKAAPVRIAAAGALAILGEEAKDAIPALQEAQNDKDKGVSRAARMAIRSIRAKKK
ncbi:MAG TPA: HEAT repeat domain-containing protein [Gemmataceae bacterium]|nr:HEAT repeat domain-containing protein [Gemmataceae bacterium]